VDKQISADLGNDGVLVVLSPQAATDATAVANALLKFKKLLGKPILASWMGNGEVADGKAILNAAGIPTFRYPDMAARAFCYMWRYTRNLEALYETPALSADLAKNL
jgi:acetyltransferase